MRKLYYLINTYPKPGMTITRVESVEVPEMWEDPKCYIENRVKREIEKKLGFQEWCK